MNVGELRKILEDAPDDFIVVLQADAEGNGYSPLAGADLAFYETETTWSGQVIDAEYLEGYDEDEIKQRLTDSIRCVVLWPVN